MKQEIYQILKRFEQRDYRRGGVSIDPASYEAICNTIYIEVIQKIKSRANCPAKQICQCGLESNWDGFCIMNKKEYINQSNSM